MADLWTKEKRSAVMSLVRGRGNKGTELALVRLLRQNGINGWRRHLSLPGNPDFTFCKHRLTLFVDGCFWHSCPRHARRPKSNVVFWRRKFSTNKKRDKNVSQTLRKLGWRVLRVWEHDLEPRRQMQVVRRIRKALKKRAVSTRKHCLKSETRKDKFGL
jgi:DNA mismatch endonuclease, patch repair protein